MFSDSVHLFNIDPESNARAIGEFFVMNKYKNKGVGKYAATQVFDCHPGIWEVCYINENIPAKLFWEKVISEYTANHYTTCGEEQDEMKGFIFSN